MSNKIALATIQFKADAKGANAALESLRQESKNAHDEVERLQKAFKNGIKTMKDANGIEFDVAKRLKEAKTQANSFEKAINEIIKGATALEAVVKNIRLGEIEKSSRGELVGAVNAVKARMRSLKEDMPDYAKIKADLASVVNEAEKQINRLDHDTEKLLQTIKEGGSIADSVIAKEVQGLKEILGLIPKGTEEWNKYNAQLTEIQNHVAKINQEQLKQTASILGDKNLGQYSENQLRAAIDAGKELIRTFGTADEKTKALAQNIVNAEKHLEQYGVVAERARQKEETALEKQIMEEQKLSDTMRQRMTNLKTLSADALAETRKYWEAQARGASEGSRALREAEAALKKINEQEKVRRSAKAEGVLGNIGAYGVSDIKAAIQEMERLRDSVRQGGLEWTKYNRYVEQGKEYLESLARSQAAERIETQMRNINTLSANGLAEVKKYWETMVAGAERGSTELATYKAKLEEVITEEKTRSKADAQQRVGILSGGNLGQFSENEIRNAIEAGNMLIKTYQTASPEAKNLAKNIVDAENYLKQYGVEAERAAQKEAKAVEDAAKKRREMDELMVAQRERGGMSESALKAQQQYWQRLIDDPKTAAESLRAYEFNLREVQRLQEQMAAQKGESALAFFRGDTSDATAAQIQENAKALKTYRDSLPQQSQADVISEINTYLQQAGVSAEKAAEQTMQLEDALKLSASAGSGMFKGTTEQLKQAKKALEEMQQKTVKGGAEWQKYQEAIRRVDLELQNTGKITKEVQAILDKPKGSSINELRMAIEQAEASLKGMKSGTEEFEQLSDSIKNAKATLQQLELQSKNTLSTFEKAWSRLKTYVGLYVSAAVALQKIVGTMGDLMELSDKMGEVRKTTGYTADEVGRLSDALAKLDTRTPIQELLNLSAAAGQLGLKAQEDVQGFTEAANKLIVALPEMGRESATALMKIANATGDLKRNGGDVQETLERVGSTIIALRANSASAAPAITDFVRRVGAVGSQAGITIDQIAAMGSTVDALGGRVEMSATALSRMIPAIRNNAFGVAKSIGETEETLNNLFNQGKAMEAMVLIFQKLRKSVKQFDTSTEEGVNAMADKVEEIMGKDTSMAEVMKELNQQGARAGIVFGLMSQNVDELEKQLKIASGAYQDNIALQNEYNNMNETTAAKWARLKNQFEEMFVSDKYQKKLGDIIGYLRKIVDLISGDGGLSIGLRSILIYIGLIKVGILGIFPAIGKGLKNIGMALGFVKGEMDKLQMGNIITAFGLAVWYAVDAFISLKNKVTTAAKAIGDMNTTLRKETKTVNDLFYSVDKTNQALSSAKKNLDEVKQSGEDTTKAEEDLKKANAEHAATIREINSKYGQYLNFMLSETASAEQLAKARDLINSKLRETITLKQKETALSNIEEEYGGEATKRVGRLDDVIKQFTQKGSSTAMTTEQQAKLSSQITELGSKYAQDSSRFQTEVGKLLKNLGFGEKGKGGTYSAIMTAAKSYQEQMKKIADATDDVEQRFEAQNAVNQERTKIATKEELDATIKEWNRIMDEYSTATGDAKKELAVQLYKQQRAYISLFENNKDYFAGSQLTPTINKNIEVMKSYEQGLRDLAGEAIKTVDAAEAAQNKYDTGGNNNDPTDPTKNPYGDYNKVTSEYSEWDANALVARRKEMLQRVRALANGADVQAVLSQDGKFITNAVKNNIKTTREAIEWYNTERLKIQDELHSRYLTNSGDWMDAGGNKGGKKKKFDESNYTLAELERYYALRKERIEDARIEEGLSEVEFNKRIQTLEQEHLQKCSELRNTFTSEDKAFIEQFRQWWEGVAELDEISWNKIENEWAVATERNIGYNNMKVQKDLTAMKNIVMKQMSEIENIIAKERPFDGITKNLEDNLTKMGILFTEAEREKGIDNFIGQKTDRMSFLLKEAEHAYSTNIQDIMKRMADAGLSSWADELRKNPKMQEALMAQLRSTYDAIHEAIKKEATLIRKQVEIQWNDTAFMGGQSAKQLFDSALTGLKQQEDSVKRANQLINAGYASERVADKLAIQQMQIKLRMQETYYQMMRKQGNERIEQLKKEGRIEDAMHVQKSLDLALTQEQKTLDEQRAAIAGKLEDSQDKLYKEMRTWVDIMSSSLQSVFEASNAGKENYYNELAKMRLTGEGSEGGTYIVIDNAGTSDAEAHYETLSGEEALRRKMEIEQQNATAEAWKQVMDDVNQKMSEMITDQLNSMMQNIAVEENTSALGINTQALYALTGALGGGVVGGEGADMGVGADGVPNALRRPEEENEDLMAYKAPWQMTEDDMAKGQENMGLMWQSYTEYGTDAMLQMQENIADIPGVTPPWQMTEDSMAAGMENMHAAYQNMVDASAEATSQVLANQKQIQQGEQKMDTKIASGSQTAFAKMTAACNLYGIAYQAMSNDNMSAAQKFGMIAVQAAGQAAITALTVSLTQSKSQTAAETPTVLSKAYAQLGPIGGPIAFGLFTGLLGGLMGLAASAIGKGKSEIAQATGVSASAGRMATGMLTYAEGNVNEFTDPGSLTPGRSYNVDAADGKTYRAKFTGSNPDTHITNGPEFHLAGEAGRELIIDAGTTRQITMNEREIFHAIQTLSNGGRLRHHTMRRGRGVGAFADGNMDEFDVVDSGQMTGDDGSGMVMEQMISFQQSIDRNSAIMERLADEGIEAFVSPYGKRGIVNGYDKYKKEAERYGQQYMD